MTASFAARTVEIGDPASAIEFCYEQGWTDGPPVVPPTRAAVDRIVSYLRRDPHEVIGLIPPRDAAATVESVAANCVMAGCLPEHAPIVIAAIQAMLEPRFNLNGVQTTTHSCAPLLTVSGPAVKKLGFRTREGAFGHGCRASFAVGRAIRLILWNVGGGYPGEPCKTTQGHPGYYSFCIAEDAETNPWEPLHVERGFAPEDTVATVTAAEGPHLVGTGAGYGPVENVVRVLADSIAVLGSPSVDGGDLVLVLAPLAAKKLADAGYTKASLKLELKQRATRPVRDMKHRLTVAVSHPAHWANFVDIDDDDARVPFIRDVENLIVTVTGGWGGGGAFCSLCPGWGERGGLTVSRRVEFPVDRA